MTQGFLENTPETLNHYTTLENLELILANKTFAFTKLSCLNDPLEGKNPNFEKAEELIFSSSWTGSTRDTLPMWRMYSGFDGIRMSLPSDLFQRKDQCSHGKWPPTARNINYANLQSPIHISMIDQCRNTRTVAEYSQLSGPDEVFYVERHTVAGVDDVLISRPRTEENGAPTNSGLHLAVVGLTKSDDWAFEQEWRFRLPFTLSMVLLEDSPDKLLKMPTPEDDRVFLAFREEVLEDLKILTGPKFSAGQMVLLNSLLERYAPNAIVTNSEIKIR